jgi:phospholipid/cholesterol/gamma-HCH transport system substrate-binding protein
MTNERVLQFRIGMFVIVAGLVLAMLIVWFGESPALFRDQRYLVVHYEQAPGVSEGIPVRKSGIRIGEVTAIQFDERPGKPDGVLVTLSIDQRYHLRAGSTPRISRGLIGDVWIDMLPGNSQDQLVTSRSPESALKYIVEGTIMPDPANALAAATDAFHDVKGTLKAIEMAAIGLSEVSKKAGDLDEFIASFRDASQKVGLLADDVRGVIGQNAADIRPTLKSFRSAAESITATFDDETQANIRAAVRQLSASSARLDKILADVMPVATDLGLAPTQTPATALGQTLVRVSRIIYNVQLLTEPLNDGHGKLNTSGTVQKLLTSAELYNNLNTVAAGANRALALAERALGNLNRFAERIANDPGAIGRGALGR